MKNNSKEKQDDLIKMFLDLGYEISWDFSAKLNSYWHEIIDPKTKVSFMQIEYGVSKEDFLKEWFSLETEGLPPFFIAAKTESIEYKNLKDKIENKKNETYNT